MIREIISWQFLRFAAVGAIGTSAHYAILVVLVEELACRPDVGSLAGFCAGAVLNYMLARKYVFRARSAHRAAMPRFMLVASVGAILNTGIVAILVAVRLHYLIAQVLATGAVLAWNFTANKRWSFGERGELGSP